MRITLTTKLFLFVVLFTPLQLFSQSFLDSHFLQPVSKKYPIESVSDSYQMKKIVISRDDNVYVLTDSGLYIIIEDRLVLDQRFRPLTDLLPVDVIIESGANALYDLDEDRYLSNAYVGIPYGEFEPGADSSIDVNESGDILRAGDRNFRSISDGLETMGRAGETVRAVNARGEEFFIETASGIHILESDGLKLIAAEDDIQAWEFGNSELFIATSKGYYSLADKI